SRAAIALTELTILGAGEDTAPLSELWELYQAWVAEESLAHLETLLGAAGSSRRRPSLLGRWSDGREIELHYTARVPAARGRVLSLCGNELYAAIGDLEPDLILAARVAGTMRMLVIDPKKRPYLDPGTVTVEASKYLWGIRGADEFKGVVL